MPDPLPDRSRSLAAAGRRATAALVLAGSVLDCARPSTSVATPLTPPLLYVANTLDGTLTRLDATSGSILGPPLPAGPTPARVVVGQHDAALVLSGDPAFGAVLTYATGTGR
jgi:hypothetical protein